MNVFLVLDQKQSMHLIVGGLVFIILVSGCVASPVVVVSSCEPGQVLKDGECLYTCNQAEDCLLVPSVGCCAYDVINGDYLDEHNRLLAVAERDCSTASVCADQVYGAVAVCEAGVCIKEVTYPAPDPEIACEVDEDCVIQKTNNCCGQKAINKKFWVHVDQFCDEICDQPEVKCVTGQCVLL